MSSLADQFLDDIGSSSSESPPSSPPPSTPSNPSSNSLQTSSRISTSLQASLSNLLSQLHSASHSSASSKYDLVLSCTRLVSTIDEEISLLHTHLQRAFAPRFPELETLIFNPLDYARVAKLCANALHLSKVGLHAILPSATVITIQVTASASAGRPLKPDELQEVHALCDALTQLDHRKGELLAYVEQGAGLLAPNLVEIVGGAVAAKLMGLAGGLEELSKMPSCNVQALGKLRKGLQGTSTMTTRMHEGVIYTCPLVISVPKKYRWKAGRVVSGKAVLAARVDACRKGGNAEVGKKLKKAMQEKFDKWQEMKIAKTQKPLPVPGDEMKRKHRGGKRARKEKERLGITDLRKLAKRVKFGELQEESRSNDLENEGMGTSGTGRVRVRSVKTDTVSMAAKRKLSKIKKEEGISEAERMGITGGALDFGKEGGLQLGAVRRGARDDRSEQKSVYFSTTTPFRGVRKEEPKMDEASHN